ncbi:MAG: HepT-like ribonuclease domain-containing protein [Beijerinckiaceae bacterium]
MRDNCEHAKQFVAGLSFEDFKTGRRTFYAVTRALEIISEAARRLPPALHERHPHLAWRAIMGVGNVYRHDYDNVAEEFVWRTVQNSLPALLAAIADEIARLGDP